MNTLSRIGVVLFICVAIGGLYWYVRSANIVPIGINLPSDIPTSTISQTTSTTTPSTSTISSSSVSVISPLHSSVVRSPLTVIGQAPGTWFFEASLPVVVADMAGRVVGRGVAQAESDWMTTALVPFHASITFTKVPTTASGTLRIEKDNPSGLPQNDDVYELPIQFDLSKSTVVQAFFYNPHLDTTAGIDCSIVSPVARAVSTTSAIAQAALHELLRGPTTEEATAGFSTSLQSGTEVTSITIRNGVASVDFNDALDAQIGGSCRVGRIRSQIVATLKQFPTVTSVVISRNGRTDDVLQP